MPLKRPHAFASALGRAVGDRSARKVELPELNGLVQTAANQVATIRGKRNGIDAVLVAIGALQAHDQSASGSVPNPDALIQGTRCNVVAIGRHGNRSDTVLNAQPEDQCAIQKVPEPHRLVPASGGDVPSIHSKVQGVDILFVARENMLDGASGNIPHLDIVLAARM